MTIKHLSAFVALGAASLVVACSGNNIGVVPAPSGATPDGVFAAAAAPASQDVLSAKQTPSPIKMRSSLKFRAIGKRDAKSFVAKEARYEGKFRVTSDCGKKVAISPRDADGPRATFEVTPRGVTSCTITVKDRHGNHARLAVDVSVATHPTATPSTAPTATPTAGATATPTARPTATPTATPTAHPTATPTAHPTATPSAHPTATPTPVGPTPTPGATPIIKNGNFATGTLSGWKACSFSHAGYSAPINASPAPQGAGAQAAGPTAPLAAPGAFGNIVGTPPPNLNPNVSGTAPPALGSHVAETGDQNSENAGASGICQTFTVDSADKYLSFWAYEGGSEYNFEYADQEADILDSTGTTLAKTLFAEDNCFWDPGKVGQTGYLNSGCIPASLGGTSSYVDWQGGYWVQRGPYDLSAYVGTSVTLFLGVWDSDTDNTPYPDTYSNEMFVGNVQLTSSSSFPTSFETGRRPFKAVRASKPAARVHP